MPVTQTIYQKTSQYLGKLKLILKGLLVPWGGNESW